MLAVALVMATNLDRNFEQSIATGLPDFLTNPTESIERSDAVASEIQDVRGGDGHAVASEGGAAEAAAGKRLPDLGAAGKFTDTQQWFNTPGGKPLSIAQLNAEGKTVLIDFWTYTCINCIRTLPYLEAWDRKYRKDGLVVVGVHSPEFPFEKDAGNVADAIASDGIHYPVVQDNELGTWNSFHNQYWPAHYLIDTERQGPLHALRRGRLRTDRGGDPLLARRRRQRLAAARTQRPARSRSPRTGSRTPETYLGAARGRGMGQRPAAAGRAAGRPAGLRHGRQPDPQGAAAERVRLPGQLGRDGRGRDGGRGRAHRRPLQGGRRVPGDGLAGPGRRSVKVLLDGKPISAADAGSDVGPNATVKVGEQRLYRLVQLPDASDHVLSLEFEPGISGYAFTFG